MNKPKISAIAAIGKNRELGKDNKLLWTIPEDLKRFRELTRDHPVIMGRKTFESIISYSGKPLPDRPNIIVSHAGIQGGTLNGDVLVASSVADALQKAKEFGSEEIFIIGGGQIYKAALPYTQKLYLTIIDDEKDADSFFPLYEEEFTKKKFEEIREWNGIKYRWINLERISEV